MKKDFKSTGYRVITLLCAIERVAKMRKGVIRIKFAKTLYARTRFGISWLLILLTLTSCGAPKQSASGIPTILPPTIAVATLASPTRASPTSAQATVAVVPTLSTATIASPTATRILSAPPQASIPRLVFRSNGIANGEPGLYRIDADGAHLTRLTTDPRDRLPAWSPDGQRIVFASDRNSIGNIDIFVINADGTGLVQLTTDWAVNIFPIWSPDGQYIAFISNRDTSTLYSDIYVIRADGTQLQRVTTNPTFENIMGWSPDSTHIFYSINHNGVWAIHTVDLDGAHDTVIIAGAAGALAPDGTAIAFIRTDSGQDDLWISAINGTNIRRITNTPPLEYSLAWSPDAKRIAFNPGLVVINADGAGRTQLSDPQTSTGEIHWSPDGKYIAFQSVNAKQEIDLAIVDVATGTRTLLTHDMSVEAGFAWSQQPDPSTPFPSPDDTTVQLARERDGWRLEPQAGRFSVVQWSPDRPAQLEAQWIPAANAQQSFFSYRVDPDQGMLGAADGGGFLVAASEDISKPLSVRLFDARTGEWQTLFSLDPAVPQWTPMADRGWGFEGAQGTIATQWVGKHSFILSIISDLYDPMVAGWGKILFVDTAMHQARVLAERGQMAAVFPDGSLLIRRGWVDGPVQLLAPPYDEPPTTLALAGPWTSDWVVSPDRNRIAWMEWTPPATGDWSQRLPHRCCSGEPQPQISALVIWDQSAQQLTRFPIDGIVWWIPVDLRWRNDSRAVYFSIHKAQPQADGITQIELGIDRQRTPLVSGEYGYSIQLVARAPDGSRYAYLTGHPGLNSVELFHQALDGLVTVMRRVEVVPMPRTFHGNPFLAWRITDQGRIIEHYDDGTVIVLDVVTGKELARFVAPPSAEVSPDGRWIAYIDGPLVRIRALP